MESHSGRKLEELRDELLKRRWVARIADGALKVSNPNAVQLTDAYIWRDDRYRYSWGQEIAATADVGSVADRIMWVLREVQPVGT